MLALMVPTRCPLPVVRKMERSARPGHAAAVGGLGREQPSAALFLTARWRYVTLLR